MCAFLGPAPQSPPSSAPSCRRRGPRERRRRDVARVQKNVNSLGEEGRPPRGRAGPPLPLHFYRRRKRGWPGRQSPRLPRPPARPARSPALPYSEPGAHAPRRVCEPVTWFPLQPSRRSAPRRRQPRAGKAGSARGVARKWPPCSRSRRRRRRLPPGCGTRRPLRARVPLPCSLRARHPDWPPPHLPPQLLGSIHGKGREATTPADSIHYTCQETTNCSKRLRYRVSASFPRQVEDPKAVWPEEGPLPQNSRDPISPPPLAIQPCFLLYW